MFGSGWRDHAPGHFALVTLTADRGSTPRAAGAEMLVRRDGSIAGTILFIKFLQSIEKQLVESLGLAAANNAGSVAATTTGSPPVRMARRTI